MMLLTIPSSDFTPPAADDATPTLTVFPVAVPGPLSFFILEETMVSAWVFRTLFLMEPPGLLSSGPCLERYRVRVVGTSRDIEI